MTVHDQLPEHLERIGSQLTAAAEELYGRDPRRRHALLHPLWVRLARAPRVALAGAGGLVVVIVALAFVSISAAPPAYALTSQGNGTYTITINSLSSGIASLNAKLRQLGINTVAVPVSTSCTAPSDGVSLVGGWPASTTNESVTLDQADIPAGAQGVVAAYQSSAGGIDLTLATTSGAVPTCLNPDNAIQPPAPSGGVGGGS
jgi:hypothetical protein